MPVVLEKEINDCSGWLVFPSHVAYSPMVAIILHLLPNQRFPVLKQVAGHTVAIKHNPHLISSSETAWILKVYKRKETSSRNSMMRSYQYLIIQGPECYYFGKNDIFAYLKLTFYYYR